MDNKTFQKDNKHILKGVLSFIRKFVSIFLALAFTDYITERYEITSFFYEFLIYFGILLFIIVLIYAIKMIFKKLYNTKR